MVEIHTPRGRDTLTAWYRYTHRVVEIHSPRGRDKLTGANNHVVEIHSKGQINRVVEIHSKGQINRVVEIHSPRGRDTLTAW